MAELRQLTSDCGRSGTAPPAKYQLRRSSTTLASGSRALIVHDSSDIEEAYRASQYSHDDTSSSNELQPLSQSLSPYDSAYYGGQPHSPPTPSPFFRPSIPPFARPPLPSPNSYAPSAHHRGRGPPRGRGRGHGNFSGRAWAWASLRPPLRNSSSSLRHGRPGLLRLAYPSASSSVVSLASLCSCSWTSSSWTSFLSWAARFHAQFSWNSPWAGSSSVRLPIPDAWARPWPRRP